MHWLVMATGGSIDALTLSTFSLDTLSLWQNGDLFLALLYALGTVVLCLAAISVAVWLTSLVLNIF